MADFETLDALEALEKVNAAILAADTSSSMLEAVLEEMLDVFSCQRAWLLYPCTLDAEWFQVPVERNRPDYPGAGATMEKQPMDDSVRRVYELALGTEGPVAFDDETNAISNIKAISETFQIKSQLVMVIRPLGDTPWMLGIHHCQEAVRYRHAIKIFNAIGRRVADGLTTMLATEELRQSEQRLRTLVEHAPEAMLLLDVDTFRFVGANPVAERLFDLSEEEILNASPESLSPEFQPGGERSDEAMMIPIEAALAGEYPLFEWQHQSAKGEPVSCEIRLARLPHPTKRLIRGSVTDISERIRAAAERQDLEARLAHSQKMEAIGNLTGGIAHDFNNLLTIVLGNLDLLEHPGADRESGHKRLAAIRTAAERASSLTHRLLAFARRQPLRPTAVDTGALLIRIQEMLRPTLGEDIDIRAEVSDETWPCLADEAQLENAIVNLAINARDAMPKGGELRIKVENIELGSDLASRQEDVRAGDYVLLSVRDDGVGMPPELITEIFSPFFTTKELGKGTGLGLSMVYGFVRQSGGFIEVESAPAQGTTMKIYLPRNLDASVVESLKEHQEDRQPVKGRGETILVVEDNEGVRQLTRMLLEELGFQTFEASTANQALEIVKGESSIQLLLTDVVLADGVGGVALADKARALRPELSVLFMSGYTQDELAVDGKVPAKVHLLAKPFTKVGLAQQVREALPPVPGSSPGDHIAPLPLQGT